MKRILVALLVFPALALAVAIGCNGAPQGNGVTCMMLVDGGTSDGGCFFPATVGAARTQCGDVQEYCDTTGVAAPNLDCLTSGSAPPPGTPPAMVTLTGFVHVFSSGPDSNGVKVQVFDAAQVTAADPANQQAIGAVTAALDPATQRACDADGSKGCSIPLATGCQLPTCNDGLGGRTDDQKYCRDNGADGECSDRLRWEARYSIAGVPTNTPLVIRVTGPGNKSDSVWATTVAFNIFLSTSDRACKNVSDTDCLDTSTAGMPKYQLNVSALSAADYVNIPVLSGLPGGITSGQGAIAGEVHDCNNVRVANVEVTTSPTADRYTYFNGNPVKTLPDASRAAVGTDRLGLFAALNERPGAVRVETAGALTAGGTLISFGAVDAFVYANAVSIVNVNGGKGKK
jgi:hypothetical protein